MSSISVDISFVNDIVKTINIEITLATVSSFKYVVCDISLLSIQNTTPPK